MRAYYVIISLILAFFVCSFILTGLLLYKLAIAITKSEEKQSINSITTVYKIDYLGSFERSKSLSSFTNFNDKPIMIRAVMQCRNRRSNMFGEETIFIVTVPPKEVYNFNIKWDDYISGPHSNKIAFYIYDDGKLVGFMSDY